MQNGWRKKMVFAEGCNISTGRKVLGDPKRHAQTHVLLYTYSNIPRVKRRVRDGSDIQ